MTALTNNESCVSRQAANVTRILAVVVCVRRMDEHFVPNMETSKTSNKVWH